LLLQVSLGRVTLAWARLTDLATAFPATVTYPYPSNNIRSFTHSSQTYSSCNTQQASKPARKIVQDSKTLTSPYLEKLSRDPSGTTTGTRALRTNYGAENRVGHNQEIELAKVLN